ncbi:MAG: GTP cyclohydrolase I [Acidobacteriota bacterium]
MNKKKIHHAIKFFLKGVGERFPGDDLEKTPSRVTKAWFNEFLSGYRTNPEKLLAPKKPGRKKPGRVRLEEKKVINKRISGRDIILARDIFFYSICVHHLLPFIGYAHIAYIPDGRIIGLSKMARVLDAFSRRLQIQERLARQVADTLHRGLNARGTAVIIEAAHLCMILRGVKKKESSIVTTCFTGCFEQDEKLRSALIKMIYRK